MRRPNTSARPAQKFYTHNSSWKLFLLYYGDQEFLLVTVDSTNCAEISQAFSNLR